MNCKCDTCVYHCGENYSSFEMNCIDNDFCSYERDDSKPLYNTEVAKQLIYGCAAELYHGMDGLSNKEIGDKLMDIIKEMDKM